MTLATDEKLRSLLRDFNIAMVVTRTLEGQLRARPMVMAEIDSNGTVWLLTERHSGKMDEIERDNQVNLTVQSSSKFASLSGLAVPLYDREKIDALWNESWKTWFPKGKDDPTLTLIKIEPQMGEYWDNSGLSGISYLIEASKAYLTGHKPELQDNPEIHAKVGT